MGVHTGGALQQVQQVQRGRGCCKITHRLRSFGEIVLRVEFRLMLQADSERERKKHAHRERNRSNSDGLRETKEGTAAQWPFLIGRIPISAEGGDTVVFPFRHRNTSASSPAVQQSINP